jgi:hypothetical protein
MPAPLESHVPVSALPLSLDWRTKGVVTPVKDQGQCGGCWSFSAAETAESIVAIATGKLMVLSEQQILSCTPNPDQCGGTGGCSGATQELVSGGWQLSTLPVPRRMQAHLSSLLNPLFFFSLSYLTKLRPSTTPSRVG